jgi:uncharacterized protein YegJ (DUF2314 family)
MKATLVAVIIVSAAAIAQSQPDRPLRALGQKQIDVAMRTEKPYIAKGRATYPAAKRRYLAGLPHGDIFYVRKWLHDPRGDQSEEVFVKVTAIKSGVVYGRIANKLLGVRSFRRGQRISFPESDVLDWTISHPDGRDEGNYVGNFMDTYKPR